MTDPPFKYDSEGFMRGKGMMSRRKYTHEIINEFGTSFNPHPFLSLLPRIMKKFNLFTFCNKTLIADYLNFAIKNDYLYDVLVWQKPCPIPTKNRHYLSDIEYCIYIKESGATFNNNLPFNYYRKVQCFDAPNNHKRRIDHPTPKPYELIKRLIAVGSNEGDIVLDPFMGSGTTAIAAKLLRRRFIGFEINEKFVKVAQQRLNQKLINNF